MICIQISQKAGKVVLYSHLYKNFPQLFKIQTVQGFRVVNETEINASSHIFLKTYKVEILVLWSSPVYNGEEEI